MKIVPISDEEERCELLPTRIMDAWADTTPDQSKVFQKIRQVVELRRTSSDSAVVDLNKASHVPIPYGKAPYRSRKARKIIQKNESSRPVPRGTWIPGVNDDKVKRPTHYMPSETPPSTMRQHQRRVLSASSTSNTSKNLCSSFNTRFMLPGNVSTSDSSSSSDGPMALLIRDDSNISIRQPKPSNIRKTKSMHESTHKIIQVAACKEPRFSTLPRKLAPQISRNESARSLNKVPIFDACELDEQNKIDGGLPGMCDITPRPVSKIQRSCTCCSICEMTSPRSDNIPGNLCSFGSPDCSCTTCIYNSKEKPGLVQYKHGDVIKTFDWLNHYAKETAL